MTFHRSPSITSWRAFIALAVVLVVIIVFVVGT